MDYLPQILVGAFLVLAAWLLLKPRYDFTIRIVNGQPEVRSGKVAAAFLSDLEDVCRDQGILHGNIHGVRKGQRVSLTFTGGIPKHCQQQLRNAWAFAR
jgi:hypothetical protein